MASVTTPTYSPSLHDALPIFLQPGGRLPQVARLAAAVEPFVGDEQGAGWHREGKISRSLPWMPLLCHPEQLRSEEHTSELQSRLHLVCRLLVEKKKIDVAPGP